MEFCELITVDRYHLGVPLSSEPKGTLSTFPHVAKILPLYVTFHGNFQTVRSEPELLIAPWRSFRTKRIYRQSAYEM